MSFTPSRRAFLKGSGVLAGGAVTSGTLAALAAHTAWAQDGPRDRRRTARRGDYGPPSPIADQDGRQVLALPRGFGYRTFSRTGERFGDGLVVPRNHDGMACFVGPGGTLRLIRNHELRNAAGNLTLGVPVADALKYDARAMGGCMTLDFDPRSRALVRQFASIGGTFVNCSGGWSWKRTGWITCEETTAGMKSTPAPFDRPHGYCFFVPAAANAAIPAVPLKWLGRFSHEASVADGRGTVYQTEDAPGGSGFYRAVPNRPDDLTGGGTLEMLAVKGKPLASLARGQTVGAALPVEWVRIDSPDPDLEGGGTSCFNQGRAKGGAVFNRLEGAYLAHDGRSVYFVSTSGGEQQLGQLWHYRPADAKGGERLALVFESPAQSVLDSPDNLCVTPSGAILFCEDDSNPVPGLAGDTHPLAPGVKDVNRLIGLGPGGEPFEFAVNVLNDGEFAGACFSPDGEILFVNLFGDATPGSGMTCAIWGPWERGPL